MSKKDIELEMFEIQVMITAKIIKFLDSKGIIDIIPKQHQIFHKVKSKLNEHKTN